MSTFDMQADKRGGVRTRKAVAARSMKYLVMLDVFVVSSVERLR
jgi:hypothetical protein